jgi:circadian clock protein KaiB
MENETDQESPGPGYILKLYVTGTTPRSARAVVNIRKICEKYLPGGYSLEVIDILQNPEAAKIDQIIAAPTLIKEFPFPSRRFIGDMSRTETIISRLDLPTP